MSAAAPDRQPVPTPTADGVRTVATTAGREVAYAEYGSSEGTPVVLFHGTPGSRLTGELYDDLARRHGVRILSVDRPGYGRSDPWPDRTPGDVGEYVLPVLNDAEVSRTGVVGFSGGAAHALALAGTHRDRVSAVELVSGAVPPALGETPRVLRALSALSRGAPWLLKTLYRTQAWAARRRSPDFVVSQFTTPDCRDDVPQEVAELVYRDFLAAFENSRDGATTESRLFTGEWGVSLDRIETRVRLYHGDRDTNVPIDGARRLSDRLPNASLQEYDGADHLTALVRSRSDLLERQTQ